MSGDLGTSEIAELLGVSRPRVWQLRKRPDFPTPAGSKDGRDYWHEHAIWRWAAQAGRALAQRAPVLFRPAAVATPEFVGGRVERGHVVHTWVTGVGRISLVHPARMNGWIEGQQVRVLDPDATTIVVVRPDFDRQGPCVDALDLDEKRFYHLGWEDLARHIGGPAPWWPSALRRPEEMIRWRPGNPTMTTPAVPAVDVAPLLHLIADEPDDSSIRTTLTYFARTMQKASAVEALDSITYLESAVDGAITLAASPASVREPGERPAEVTRRDAWARILERTDSLADRCVSLALQWDGGHDFPFSTVAQVEPTSSGPAEDWAHTLEPAVYTAAHHALPRSSRYLRDPATGLPAVADDNGIVWAAIAHRLPTTSPLAEVILESNVWIRTEDGRLYLCPERVSDGISYGYDGTGPLNLANLLNDLLDDITAGIPDRTSTTPPPGLLSGATGGWARGDVITRVQLVAARG